MLNDAKLIYESAIKESLPDAAVIRTLGEMPPCKGRLILVAIGKAAWQMASAAYGILGDKISSGAVITKYGHSRGAIGNIEIYEAAHPVPDAAGLAATARVLEITGSLTADDTVLFLVSGGGSALFEHTDIPISELQGINSALLASGASIAEVNTIRKRLSNVKGGRFAKHVAPAQVYTVALSDVLYDKPDVIASGPTVADSSTTRDALDIIARYSLKLSAAALSLITRETPKQITNASFTVSGSVSVLCKSAARAAQRLGYTPLIITDTLDIEARDAGKMLARLAIKHKGDAPIAIIAGGETVVHLRGGGLGGRNQELALSFAIDIAGQDNVVMFSVGSDGTDGPTDAAGGIVTGGSAGKMRDAGLDPVKYLENNDSYHALGAIGALIKTGPTGTNVNDVACVLIKP